MVHLSIVGMGYVGIPLALSFDIEGYDVVGYDTDERKIASLQNGDDPTDEVGSDAVGQSDITFTADPAAIEGSEYYIITVPTPVDGTGEPDLKYVESAGFTVGNALTEGSTVVLESTVYPGATREVLLPVLEAESGAQAGESFFVGYSPERIVPGNSEKRLSDIVKIVSGQNDDALERVRGLYDDIIDAGTYAAPSMDTAEAAKCLENTQRDVNIALMNEFALACQQIDMPMNGRDVIEAAATKWNFHEYHPGSVGGHCIPVDPNYLIWKFEQHGVNARVMQAARTVNSGFASRMADITVEALTERTRLLERETEVVNADGGQIQSDFVDAKPRILVLGLAYKPNTTDVRSPVLEDAIDQLRNDVDIVGVDPHVPDDKLRKNFDIPVQAEFSAVDFDALLLTTPHDRFTSLDLGTIGNRMNELPVLVDVTGTYESQDAVEHGFLYRGL